MMEVFSGVTEQIVIPGIKHRHVLGMMELFILLRITDTFMHLHLMVRSSGGQV